MISIADDLARNIADGDANYLGLLAEADAYIDSHGLDLPPEENAKIIGADPDCMKAPIRQIDLAKQGINTIIWATGYVQDFSWLKVDAFDADGKPLRMTAGWPRWMGFIFLVCHGCRCGDLPLSGVWEDAKYLAARLAPVHDIFCLFAGYACGQSGLSIKRWLKRLTKPKFPSPNLRNLSRPQDISLRLNKQAGWCMNLAGQQSRIGTGDNPMAYPVIRKNRRFISLTRLKIL